MASYAPPTQDSAIFNPLFFVSGQEGLTLNEAKKFFLQYPDAQGTENLETTNVDGVLTANDQAFFNDKITLEQTEAGGDALNILVDSPGYAIRATTRTNPTTNTQLTIIPSATDGEINSMVKLGDALLYSSTGQIASGSMSLTAYNAGDDFGVRLNGDDDVVEIGGMLELMTDTGIQFYDGTIQNTAYTGDGSETLDEVLAVGNDAGGYNITNLPSIAGTTYFLGDSGGGSDDTQLFNTEGGNIIIRTGDGITSPTTTLNINKTEVSVYNALTLVGTDIPLEFSDGTIQTTAYTGDGTDTLGDVLDNGNIATQDIFMNNNNLTFVNNLQFGQNPGLLMSLTSNTLYVSQLASNPSVNNMVSYDPATGLFTYCPSAYQPGSINIGDQAGQGSAGLQSVHIGTASGGTSGDGSVGIGINSGIQGKFQSVAIGSGSGFQLGDNSIAIGANAGGNLPSQICLNATGQGLTPPFQNSFCVAPIRVAIPFSQNILFYDENTKEITYANYEGAGLASNLLVNNSAGITDIDMNTNNILNVGLINGVAYPPPAGSANLTSLTLNYAVATLQSGQFIQNNLNEQLNIPSGGRWLIQTSYRIYSGTDSTASQELIGSRFTLQGFGGFGAVVSYQDYTISTFTNGSYSSRLGFSHSTSSIVGNQSGFTMFALVEIPGQNLAGGCKGEGYATAIRIGDYP